MKPANKANHAWAFMGLGFLTIFVVIGCRKSNLAPETHTTMSKVCLFSPIKGKVVHKGKPVPGAVLTREYFWEWGDKKATDKAVTDENGEFNFPAIYGTMIMGGWVFTWRRLA